MSTLKLYINFKELNGPSLDADFMAWCVQEKIKEISGVIQMQTVTGHTAYLVEVKEYVNSSIDPAQTGPKYS